jgi:hypothetical protein
VVIALSFSLEPDEIDNTTTMSATAAAVNVELLAAAMAHGQNAVLIEEKQEPLSQTELNRERRNLWLGEELRRKLPTAPRRKYKRRLK